MPCARGLTAGFHRIFILSSATLAKLALWPDMLETYHFLKEEAMNLAPYLAN